MSPVGLPTGPAISQEARILLLCYQQGLVSSDQNGDLKADRRAARRRQQDLVSPEDFGGRWLKKKKHFRSGNSRGSLNSLREDDHFADGRVASWTVDL